LRNLPHTMTSEPRPEVKFDIKLLSGKTVVMVECPGYESELFMPQIVKGRITFQNIIPNRRCCPESILLSDQFLLRGEVGAGTRQLAGTPLRSSQASNIASPLARSTPSSVTSLNTRASREKSLHATPEPVRAIPLTSLDEVELDLGVMHMAPDLEVSTASLPSPGARFPYKYQSPSLPESRLSPPAAPSYNIVAAQLKESISNSPKKEHAVRTYSRKKGGSPGKAKATVWSPLHKKKKEKVSLTKAPSPTMKVEVKPKRKLIVDNKKTIAPHDSNKILSMPITKKKIIRKQVTGKTRKQFEALKATAYDLLTNPSLNHMSLDLRKQFQLACMDKCATTLPNYAEVAVTSPLELDRQVKSLMAKQKRMDRKERIPKSMTSMIGKLI
ncbi:hypothetical protein KR074_005738, partial [Drosophila pseudoananassae]